MTYASCKYIQNVMFTLSLSHLQIIVTQYTLQMWGLTIIVVSFSKNFTPIALATHSTQLQNGYKLYQDTAGNKNSCSLAGAVFPK